MKAREFDELVRQKFDQDDFAYNPAHWDQLAEELDGRKTKRRTLFVWWAPLVGVAASMAIALGASTVLRNGSRLQPIIVHEVAQAQHRHIVRESQCDTRPGLPQAGDNTQANDVALNTTGAREAGNDGNWFAIRYENVKNYKKAAGNYESDRFADRDEFAANDQYKKKSLAVKAAGYYTFRDEEKRADRKSVKTAIMITGGVARGNQGNGYTLGASARHMVSEHIFIEGDVAFVGTSNSMQSPYLDMTHPAASASAAVSRSTARITSNANKTTSGASPVQPVEYQGTIKNATENYNLYYAQVTPTLGYKISRLSIGMGPDFQQLLVDNRPAPSTVERNTIKEDPTFDIGMMGKTEYAVTRNIKAAVFYRESINNVLTPMGGKYIDRNYVQFQVKCAIFNK